MKLRKQLLFLILSLVIFNGNAFATNIPVTDEYDFMLALDYAQTNGIDTIFLTTSGGIYTTTDTNYFHITKPLAIVAQPGLAEMPIFTHSAVDSSVIEMFRVSNDLTVEGIIFDGGHERSHGMKYALRGGDGPDDSGIFHKTGFDIRVKNCIFRNIYDDKEITGKGHGIYFLKGLDAGTVKVENSVFENIGDEAIRMTETEKYTIDRCLDSLIIRNCTFTNIDAECIRFYADSDTSTTDAFVLIENLTINNSATRTMYIKNNQNAVVRNIIISNGRLPDTDRADRSDYLIEVQQRGSNIWNVDTFNVVFGPLPREEKLRTTKNSIDVDPNFVFSFDPLYANASNGDFTLDANSPAYYSGVGNVHIGDLKWAVNTPTRLPLNLVIDGEGSVTFDPVRLGLTFAANANVNLTAVPDSGWAFKEWQGDITGSTNPASIQVDGIKNVTAVFEVDAVGIDENLDGPVSYSLDQNYPNPFNPSTTIKYSLAEDGLTTLKIYNVLGQEIYSLVNEIQKAGSYNVNFDASSLSTGVYYYQIKSENFISTKKMMLIK